MKEKDIKELIEMSSPLMFENEIFIKPTRRFISLLSSALDEAKCNSKLENESEKKSMLHNVTVKCEQEKVLEEFWLMRAEKKNEKYPIPYSESFREKELDHEPTLKEIAQYLYESKSDFVSVVHNYRFVCEIPFC